MSANNQVLLRGTLTAPVTLRDDNPPRATLLLAVRTAPDVPVFYCQVNAFGAPAIHLPEELAKGDRIEITGELYREEWTELVKGKERKQSKTRVLLQSYTVL